MHLRSSYRRPYVPPRPRSVAARADARLHTSFKILKVTVMAAVVACGFAPAPLVVGTVLIGALFVRDLLALGSTLRASRRMARGLPPRRAGVDYGVGPNLWVQTVAAEVPYRAQDRSELAALGSPSAAARLLAVNLPFHAACLATPALLLWGFVAVTTSVHCYSYVGATNTAANSIRAATILYLNMAPPGACPSVAQLKEGGLLERGFSARDPWGNSYEVTCDADEITVRTEGPDHKPGTHDDIVVPPPNLADADTGDHGLDRERR